MNNDKDGDRWRLWCRVLGEPGSVECRELLARLAVVSADTPADQAVAAMNAAMDEVLALVARRESLQELADQAQALDMGY